MKIRIIFWTMMTVVITATGILVWFHRSSSAQIRTQTQTISTVAKATIQVVSPNLAVAHQPVQTAKLQEQPTSDIQTIINARADYHARLENIQALTGKLTDLDREALYGFLRERGSDDDQQSEQVLKNQLLDALCEMQPPPQGLGELLSQIYQDHNQNIVLRDYAVQHLTVYYKQMAGASDVEDQTRNDELKLAQQTLWQAVNETDNSIAGTALLGLTRLSQEGFSDIDQAKIADKALDMADQNGNELTRITAFQVCASLNVKDVLPMALGAAEQGETESVEISAIGALGLLGGKDQLPFLSGVLQGNDERLKLPAEQAMNRINQRLQQ